MKKTEETNVIRRDDSYYMTPLVIAYLRAGEALERTTVKNSFYTRAGEREINAEIRKIAKRLGAAAVREAKKNIRAKALADDPEAAARQAGLKKAKRYLTAVRTASRLLPDAQAWAKSVTGEEGGPEK